MTISQKVSLWCVALIVGGVLVLAWTDERDKRLGAENQARIAKQNAGAWKAKYAEAAVQLTRRDTVWLKAKAQLESVTVTLDVHDTVQVIQFVEKSKAAVLACSDLADSCRLFRITADSTIRALEREREAWKVVAAKNKPTLVQRSWPLWFVAGVALGVRAAR